MKPEDIPRHEDYIVRLTREVGVALLALFAVAASGNLSEAQELHEEATRGLLGPHADVITTLDPESATTLIQDPEIAALYAKMLVGEAEILRGSGREADADAREARALGIALHVERLSEVPVAAAVQVVDRLSDRVDGARLDARTRAFLEDRRLRRSTSMWNAVPPTDSPRG